MTKNPDRINYIKLIKPGTLVVISFMYLLGLSVVHFLGGNILFLDALLGFLICLLIFEMRNFLGAYFDHPESYHSTLKSSDPDRAALLKIKRALLLQYSLLILTAGATLTTILIISNGISGAGLVMLGLALILNFFSAAPPLRLGRRGYDELIEAVFIANLVPFIAFLLQRNDPVILLVELTLPLTLVYLACKIALEFKDYGFDITHGRENLIVRLGWQKAVVIHNLLLLAAFLLFGVFFFLGLAWSLTWPLLLALPVAGLQILHLQRITEGIRPKWAYLRWLASGLFLILVYLEVISLWF